MKIASPVIPGEDHKEIIIAEHQDEYQNLPAIFIDGGILCRWEVESHEKPILIENGKLFFYQMTFGKDSQFYLLLSEKPELKELEYAELNAEVLDDYNHRHPIKLTDGFLYTHHLEKSQVEKIAESGNVWLFIKTNNQPLQPILLMVEEPEISYS